MPPKKAKRKRSDSMSMSSQEDAADNGQEETQDREDDPHQSLQVYTAPIAELEAKLPTVYFPDFYPEVQTMSQEELKAKEWLTPELVAEIQQFFPSEHDIQGPDGVRKKESLAQQMEEMFPVERKFASWKQLQQSIVMFSRPWGFNASHTNSKFICSFGKKAPDKSYVSKGIRKRGPSAKDLIECPFEIRYATVGFTKVARLEKIPSLRYQVKITFADYDHTCGLSPATRQLALRMSRKLGAPKDDDPDNSNNNGKKPYRMMPSVAYEVEKKLKADKERERLANQQPPPWAAIPVAALEGLKPPPPPPPRPDRPSRFRLNAFGGFQHTGLPVLQVETPILNGELLWKIGYRISPESTGVVHYAEDNLEGVATFVNGFLNGVGGAAQKVELSDGNKKLCQWWVPVSATEDTSKTRLDIIKGALTTLLTDDST